MTSHNLKGSGCKVACMVEQVKYSLNKCSNGTSHIIDHSTNAYVPDHTQQDTSTYFPIHLILAHMCTFSQPPSTAVMRPHQSKRILFLMLLELDPKVHACIYFYYHGLLLHINTARYM